MNTAYVFFLLLTEREERERLEQEQREEEEREYQERLRKLEEQERKQRARQQEIEERERRREEERRGPPEEKAKVEINLFYFLTHGQSLQFDANMKEGWESQLNHTRFYICLVAQDNCITICIVKWL